MSKSFANMDLCEKIKYLRKEKDLSQGALSRISGVSVAEICRMFVADYMKGINKSYIMKIV